METERSGEGADAGLAPDHLAQFDALFPPPGKSWPSAESGMAPLRVRLAFIEKMNSVVGIGGPLIERLKSQIAAEEN